MTDNNDQIQDRMRQLQAEFDKLSAELSKVGKTMDQAAQQIQVSIPNSAIMSPEGIRRMMGMSGTIHRFPGPIKPVALKCSKCNAPPHDHSCSWNMVWTLLKEVLR